MKIPAWLRKKPSGTRTAQQLRDDCVYWKNRSLDWEQQSKNWQQDVMRWRVHAQAAESKLAAALLQKDEWKHYADYWRDHAGVAESKLAARQASLAKYEVKRKAKRLRSAYALAAFKALNNTARNTFARTPGR
jgi:hypothetical protein